MTPPLWQKPNSLLMKVKKEGEKVGFKFNIQKTKFMASGPITSWQIDMETVTDFTLLHWKITEDANYSLEIKRHLIFGRKTITNLDSILKSRDITLPTKVCLVKALVFSSSHIWIWEFDYKESWVLKNWCFWTVVLVFFGRNDAKAETPIIWPPDARNWLTGRNPDAGKDWRQEENSTTENEMVGWHQRLDGHEFEWTLGVGDGQESLVCCIPWGHKVRHNWAAELNWL